MIFLLIVIALGFFPKQDRRYWLFAVSAIAAHLVADLLFNVGFLSDGYITQIVKQSTKNNFNDWWMFLFEIVFGWGLSLYLIHKGYKRKNAIESLDKTE